MLPWRLFFHSWTFWPENPNLSIPFGKLVFELYRCRDSACALCTKSNFWFQAQKKNKYFHFCCVNHALLLPFLTGDFEREHKLFAKFGCFASFSFAVFGQKTTRWARKRTHFHQEELGSACTLWKKKRRRAFGRVAARLRTKEEGKKEKSATKWNLEKVACLSSIAFWQQFILSPLLLDLSKHTFPFNLKIKGEFLKGSESLKLLKVTKRQRAGLGKPQRKKKGTHWQSSYRTEPFASWPRHCLRFRASGS